MLRVDLKRRRIDTSVRDLVEQQDGIPRSLGPIARVRAELGIERHAHYRKRREAEVDDFEAEVQLQHSCAVDGFEVRLRGRADGVIRSGSTLVVEEVKSLGAGRRQLQRLVADSLPAARSQLQLYCLMLAANYPEHAIEGRLVVASVIDGSWREIPVVWDPQRVNAELRRLVQRALRAARATQRRARRRARWAAELRFPYPEPRPYQQELIDGFERALEAERPALAMAPTGIGKTIAAMLAGLEYALAHDATLLFLTSKTTQQARVVETFADLVATGPRPQALTLRAKAAMCPPGTLLCHPDHCAHLRNVLEPELRQPALQELAADTTHITPEAIYAVGDRDTLCPHALSLALTHRVDLVICDINYVYDPFVALSMIGDDETSSRAVVVLDEAHNLFDRARAYYSPFVAVASLRELTASLERGDFEAPVAAAEQLRLEGLEADVDGEALFRDLADLLATVAKAIASAIDETRDADLPTIEGCCPIAHDALPWQQLGDRAARLLVRYVHYNQVHRIVHRDDPVVETLQRLHRLRTLSGRAEPELVPYLALDSSAPNGPGAGLLCVNPATKLTPRYERAAGTLAMSATLMPIDYWSDVLGLTPLSPVQLSLPSPFPDEHRLVRIVPTVDTTYRSRQRYYAEIAAVIDRVVATRPGHYVAYFPSFAFLDAIRQRLGTPAPTLAVQHRDMAGPAREAILSRLLEDPTPVLLLAVAGGVFAEGIDLPGAALIGAIVVGPSLPRVGFERALMQSYFDESHADGFARAMLYPGMQRVIQAAGRVHRRPQDVGAIVLLGRRFTEREYSRCLPAWWSRYDATELVTEDPAAALEQFWDDVATAPPA